LNIAAATRLVLEESADAGKRRVLLDQVQSFVRITFHRQNAAVRREQLLEHWHLKHTPEQIAFQYSQFAMCNACENNDGCLNGRQRQTAGFDRVSEMAQQIRGTDHGARAADTAAYLADAEIRRERGDPQSPVVRREIRARHLRIWLGQTPKNLN
jgi:hypothetical protein